MASPLPLEGDGLVENLFHYLWTLDDLGGGPRVSVPPTIVYRGSQPIAWYFSSRKSGRIKRKHRANLTPAHIEHSFTKRKAATDIVAYYLYLTNSESTSPAIEYFDAEALREFLFKRPEVAHSSSPGALQSAGILQQFSLPKGARNSTLRAIWSPKLCLLERRVNVHAIHDARFSVYERGVTFEEGGGAEALSRPEPVRGSMLPGMVQQVCERVVDHVTRVSYHKFRIARMVLRLQVDADDRLWLLWSSSLRLQPPLGPATSVFGSDIPTDEPSIRPLDIVSDAKVPKFAFAQGSGGPVSISSMDSPEVDEETRPGQTRCASCAQVVAQRALLPTTYKAVLAHFQHVLRFLRERVNEENQVAIEWPPDDRVVQQAGGVGFGILRHLKSVSASSDDSSVPKLGSGIRTWQGRELLVPPVIRYMHPTLRTEDFARHRQDPIFLHKTVGVCERCCLVYADYATASLEANGLGIRTSASAPALLRPVREKPKYAEYFDDDPPGSLLLASTNSSSPWTRGARSAGSKTKPPASAWKPVSNDERQQSRSTKFKAGPHSTLHSLPMAPKLPPRIDAFESDDNDALRIPEGVLDGSPQQQQQREEAFFRELYQQKDTAKRGNHALRHMLEAADRLSKAKPQHRLAALGNSTQIGQSQSTGALVDAITELNLAKKPGKSPYSIVQRIRGSDGGKGSSSKNQIAGKASSIKSPLKQEPAKKTVTKKKHGQGGGGAERTQFVSSREKRAAAEYRDFLVAALSDAQVQLEHIESLATLVIQEPGIEADSIEHDPKDNGDTEKQPPSPQNSDAVDREEEEEEEEEKEKMVEQQQLDSESESGDDVTIEQVELERPNPGESDGETQENNELLPQEEDASIELQMNEEETQNDEQYEEQNNDVIQQPLEEQLQGEETLRENESLLYSDEQQNEVQESQDQRGFDEGTWEIVQQVLEEAVETLEGLEENGEAENQDLHEVPSNDMPQQQSEEQLQDEETSQEPEPNEEQLQFDEQQLEEDSPSEGRMQDSTLEVEQRQLDEQVRDRDDEEQDEYEDEYEDEDQGNEQQLNEPSGATDEAKHETEPAQNFLEQAQGFLASSVDTDDTSDEHQAAHDQILFGDSNPLPVFADESSDDAVIAADSAVAAALPLPLSDEFNSAASDA